MTRTLHSGTRNASSWAFRVKEAGIPFDEAIVDIRRPQRLANVERIREFSPPGAVPMLVLVDDGTVIFDSLAIMELRERTRRRRLPSDLRERTHVRSLLTWQHAGLSGLCPRLSFESAFYPDRRAIVSSPVKQTLLK